ncbi:hypothetical protein [Streptosporangium sp. NPDC051022]|uniref:hypothetical protein n=1 Tax=Streptosporangium sp. NPDC051022 TaxID=3155752 RepID=UPI0034245ECC
MIGCSRPQERHRDGQAHVTVHRRVWDGPARATAEQLDQAWPDWLVFYSLGERRFYAIATWPVPEPLTIADESAESLQERMREAEMDSVRRALPAPPPPDSRGGLRSQRPVATPHPPRHPYRRVA